MKVVTLPKDKSKLLAETIEKLRSDAELKMRDKPANGAHAWYFGYVDQGLKHLVTQLQAGAFFTE